MEKKDQEQYALLLMKRLEEMINENIRVRAKYKTLQYKMEKDPKYCLTEEEYDTYVKYGVAVSRSAIKRVRIELNQILKEME